METNKKFTALVVIFLFLFYFEGHSQKNTSLISNKLIWYGIDYTHVHLIGGIISFTDTTKIRDFYFNTWNQLVVNEYKKFNVRKWFKKDDVNYCLDYVLSENVKPKMKSLMINQPQTISDETIEMILSKVNTPDACDSGIGAIVIMENMVKLNNNYAYKSIYSPKKGYASMIVVVFDTEDKRIIGTQRIKGKVAGVGFRNNWANTIYKAFKHFNYRKL